jgi:hypothetical protein
VTASDRPDDHFVDAGMSLLLPAHADVLIGAERDTHVKLVLATPAAAPHASEAALAACPAR